MDLNVTLAAPPRRTPRILRLQQIIDKVGLSRATIYRLMECGLFPYNIKIGIRAVGWLESEVEMWITERQILDM
jgi:prophage regulatory protein